MQFQLTTPHYMHDQLLDGGTVIGDGTPYPLPKGFKPSIHMAPLDTDAERAVKDWTERFNRGNPIDRLPTQIAPYHDTEDRGEVKHKYDTVKPQGTYINEQTIVEQAKLQLELNKQAEKNDDPGTPSGSPAAAKAAATGKK